MSDVEHLVKPDDDKESVILTTYNDNNQMNNDNSDYSGRKYWDRVTQLGVRLRRFLTDDYIDIQQEMIYSNWLPDLQPYIPSGGCSIGFVL